MNSQYSYLSNFNISMDIEGLNQSDYKVSYNQDFFQPIVYANVNYSKTVNFSK